VRTIRKQSGGGVRSARAPGRAAPAGPLWSASIIAGAMLVLGLVCAAYANSLHTAFILDDVRHIVKSSLIRPPLSFLALLRSWRPMVVVSLALNYRLGGLDVFGYHVLNLLAHVMCGAVVFGFTRFTLRLPVFGGRYAAHASQLALCVAALFLLHPVQTESVTYVYQRAEIFGAMSLLGAVWVAALGATGSTPAFRWVPALAAIAACGMLSKETFVVLPALVALYDWCFIAAGRWPAMRQRWRLYALLGVLAAGSAALAASWQPVSAMESVVGRWQYLGWQGGTLLYYVRVILFPADLCFDCGYFGPWPVVHSSLGSALWTPVGILAVVGIATWRLRERYPLATFCVWGGAIILAPTSSIFPVTDVYVEHRLYLPVALAALLVVAGAFDMSEAVARRKWAHVAVTARTVFAVTACVVLAGLTSRRNALYADVITLYRDAVTKAPESRRVRFNLAVALDTEGRSHLARQEWDAAIAYFQDAIRTDGDYSTRYFGRTGVQHITSRAYVNLGYTYWTIGRQSEAIAAWEAARRLEPELAITYRHLAKAYRSSGDTAQAIAAAQEAVQREPRNLQAHVMLGDLYADTGRPDVALREYRAAWMLDPHDQEVTRRLNRVPARVK
jgi:tetratricopeptide (TPR) repeat protein